MCIKHLILQTGLQGQMTACDYVEHMSSLVHTMAGLGRAQMLAVPPAAWGWPFAGASSTLVCMSRHTVMASQYVVPALNTWSSGGDERPH